MTRMRMSTEIDELRARETNELMEYMKQEVEYLRNHYKLETEENNSLKAEKEKYRFLFFLCLLIICGMAGIHMWSVINRQRTMIQIQTLKEELRGYIDEMHDKQLSELRDIRADVEVLNQTEFVWPINEWAAKIQCAKDGSCERIFSDVFYSHDNGYKMSLSVYPNGNGDGKNTHLSIFFYLMRGPFDNILSWPFKHIVTISIINQYTGINHISDITTFDNFPNHINWNKPTTDRNGGLGTNKLIELAELSKIPGLCQDDKIFIRCVVR